MTAPAALAASTARSAIDLIGNTPLVEVTHFDTGPCRLFLKLESQNPGGSIKDRIAIAMVEAAEKAGQLKPGATIIEATAGNTGLGLALIAALRGYKLLLVVPDKMAREKVMHCRALGADVRLTRSDVTKGHPEYYQDMARRLAQEIEGSFYVNQFGNLANPKAHHDTTAPEILAQMGGDVDAVVCGVGSGGTLTGIGQYMAAHSPKTAMVLADPVGSILAPFVNTGELIQPGSWAVEGIGEDFFPPILDLSFVKAAYAIPDTEAVATARDLLLKEGILAGSSSGTLIAAALRYCREQTAPKRVVSFVCDSGAKYLSKMFSDAWLLEQGFLPRKREGKAGDLITRRHERGEIVSVRPTDTLKIAYSRMRAADVSQLPVLDDAGTLVGLVDESDLLRVIQTHRDPAAAFRDGVETAMTRNLHTTPADAPLSALSDIFKNDRIAIVVEGDKFLGLATRVDLLNYYLLGPR